jgi:hypothetical protein
MDAYVTPNARLALTSAAAVSKGALPAGFLTGHIRGGRFIVEGFVAADAIALADPDAFFALDALQPGRVIGFLVPGVAAAARKPLLRPHAVGRLVLALRKKPGTRNPEFVGWSVDYDGRFFFAPSPIAETGKEPR